MKTTRVEESREEEDEFDRLFPSDKPSFLGGRQIDPSSTKTVFAAPPKVQRTKNPLHWYERERQNQDGTVLPRVPSVVPTTTMKCASMYCECCRCSSNTASHAIRFERTTRSLPLPRLKRRWWDKTRDDDSVASFSFRTSKKARTQYDEDQDDTPLHWALELQSWIDTKLNPLLDYFDGKQGDSE